MNTCNFRESDKYCISHVSKEEETLLISEIDKLVIDQASNARGILGKHGDEIQYHPKHIWQESDSPSP